MDNLSERIAKLPVEKRRRAADLLHEACLAINSVEVLLIGTDMEGDSLWDEKKHPTLWCQLYDLKKKFEIR